MKGLILRLSVTALLLYLIFRSVDVTGVAATFRQMDLLFVAFAVLFQVLSQTVAAERWHRVMKALAYPMGPAFYWRSFFKGSFFNQGLPTSIGGDAVRVLDVAGEGHRKRDAFSGVLIDRGLGVMGLLLLNAAANLSQPDRLPDDIYWLINGIVAAGVVGFLLLWQCHRLALLARMRLLYPFSQLSRRLAEVLRGRRALQQLALSVAVHLLSMGAVISAGYSVGLTYDPIVYLVVVPPAILLTVIPISLAGWGVREGALIGLFALVGADKVTVLAMSILYGLTLILASLPGLYVYLTGRRTRAVSA